MNFNRNKAAIRHLLTCSISNPIHFYIFLFFVTITATKQTLQLICLSAPASWTHSKPARFQGRTCLRSRSRRRSSRRREKRKAHRAVCGRRMKFVYIIRQLATGKEEKRNETKK